MEKRQTVDFSDSVVAYDIKIDLCKELHELLKKSST